MPSSFSGARASSSMPSYRSPSFTARPSFTPSRQAYAAPKVVVVPKTVVVTKPATTSHVFIHSPYYYGPHFYGPMYPSVGYVPVQPAYAGGSASYGNDGIGAGTVFLLALVGAIAIGAVLWVFTR